MIEQILFCLVQANPSDFAVNPILWKALIIAAGAFLLTYPVGLLMDLFLNPFHKQINKKFPPNSLTPIAGLKDGGRIIGYVERLLIFVFILSGQFSGVGFLLAAKSISRFGELKDCGSRKQSEFNIIGTFTSFLLAIVVSLAVQAVLKLV